MSVDRKPTARERADQAIAEITSRPRRPAALETARALVLPLRLEMWSTVPVRADRHEAAIEAAILAAEQAARGEAASELVALCEAIGYAGVESCCPSAVDHARHVLRTAREEALRERCPRCGHPDCTCGSGAHPRRCAIHPGNYEAHIKQMNCETEIEDLLADTLLQQKRLIEALRAMRPKRRQRT